MRLLPLALCVLVATAAHARGEILLLGEGDMTTMNNWEVSRQKWETQPKWSPTSSQPPPLTIQKAVQVGEVWIKKRHPDVKEFVVGSVALVPQASWSRDIADGWFYRIEFDPRIAGKRMRGGHFVAVVLLDGSVVEPRPEPARRN